MPIDTLDLFPVQFAGFMTFPVQFAGFFNH